MDTYKKLFNNIFIFSLGTLGSKLIAFLLVPFYTHYLTQGEYGTTDLVLITVQMLLPLVSMAMNEAIIRYTMNKEYNNTEILTNSTFVSVAGYFIFLLFFPFLRYLNIFDSTLPYLYLLLLFQIINQSLTQYSRGIGQVRVFAINGVLTTFLAASLNILFIAILDLGVDGYFLSLILSYILSSVYLIFKVKPLEKINSKFINLDISKQLLKFSLPLIPNNLIWWIINGSSRYFINFFVGIEANGIFAVSSKIPSLINIVTTVFSQAWQLSVFEEYEDERKDNFYTNIFDMYMSILFLAVSGIILVLKPMFQLLFSISYFEAWKPVPFLLIGIVFSALSSFLGVSYTAAGQTKGVFTTSVYGGIASVASSVIFIPLLGTIGAGISSMISFVLMFLIRYFDTKKLLTINVKWVKLTVNCVLISLQTFIIFTIENLRLEFILQSIILMLIVFNNRILITYVVKIVKNLMNKK